MLWTKNNCFIPADVPRKAEKEFCKNYVTITKNTNNLFMFACDQKIEHLNKDFYGSNISLESLNPEHIFKIAQTEYIGAFATHLGIIARYGKQYPTIPYIAKLNGKTDLIKSDIKDPRSASLWCVSDAVKIKEETGINICGVGLTLYIGSKYESEMLQEAAQIIYEAHQHGFVAVIWIYARGASIQNDQDPQLSAGACGLAVSLGADFVKIKPPSESGGKSSAEWLKIAATAAGNTRVICSGGEQVEPRAIFKTLHDQITIGETAGCAIGRNIFQRSLSQARAIAQAISMIVYKNASPEDALKIYDQERK